MELHLLRNSIKLHNERNGLKVEYPYIRDPACLPYNYNTASSMAKKLEDRLERDGRLEQFNVEFNKFLDRKAIVPVTKEDLRDYIGPKQFILHHPVFKESSGSKHLRIVSNASLTKGGTSLSRCLPKGPNSLNDCLQVLLRLRT